MRLLAWVKQYILRRDEMSMGIVKFGYTHLVLPTEQAVKIADILLEAEVYEQHYARDENDKTIRTQHIYKKEDLQVDIEVISDTKYKMYKLAGKPKEA